jgi:tetratricopeptide (TPR) repeat protein
MNKTRLFIIGGASILFIAGVAQFLFPRTAVSPAPSGAVSKPPTVEPNTPASLEVKAVSVTPANRPAQAPFAIAQGDTIVSWDFKGVYTDNPELVAKAQAEIKRLSEQLATATSSAMILSVGIANQYELLGKGKEQYDYLGRAIQASPEDGLPWHNLGVLMERLGAFETARRAYEQSTIVQPEFPLYHFAYLEFLIRNMKNDTVSIEKAFAAAEKNIGKRQYLIDLRAKWETS